MAKYLRIVRTARLISTETKEYNFAVVGEVLKIVGTFWSRSLDRELPVVQVENNGELHNYLFVHHNVPTVLITEEEAGFYILYDRAVHRQSSLMRATLLSHIKDFD